MQNGFFSTNEELQQKQIVSVEDAKKATNEYFCGDELADQIGRASCRERV